MSGSPRVAVVIVSFATRDTLVAGLDALAANAGLAVETVVVDNASPDGSPDAVRARFPSVRLVANPENVGFARACNQGARETRAPFVLFLNPDATLDPGALEALVRLLETRPRVGIVGPRTRSSNGDIQVSTGAPLSLVSEWRQRRLVLGVSRRDARALAEADARHAVEHEPGWVSGACLLARREAFDAVSGFDERFFLYEEDADLCRRVRAAGWQVRLHARGRGDAREGPQHGARAGARPPRVPPQPPPLLPQALRPAAARRAEAAARGSSRRGPRRRRRVGRPRALPRGRGTAAPLAPRALRYLTTSSVSSASTTSPVSGSTADARVTVSPSWAKICDSLLNTRSWGASSPAASTPSLKLTSRR